MGVLEPGRRRRRRQLPAVTVSLWVVAAVLAVGVALMLLLGH
jgi:hypothetical protein